MHASRRARSREASCGRPSAGPYAATSPATSLDLAKPIGRYDCVAVTQDVIQGGKVVAKFGLPFVAAIDFRRGRLTWCKNNPAPSERGEPLAFATAGPACLGLPPVTSR